MWKLVMTKVLVDCKIADCELVVVLMIVLFVEKIDFVIAIG